MKLPQKRSERVAALILLGLFFGVIAVAGIAVYLANQKPELIPIKDALWVTDWDVEKIYGPGTSQQKKILEQFDSDLKFTEPVLYRMGGSQTSRGSEGLLMYGFDPAHPEMAKLLVAKQEPPNKSREDKRDHRRP